MGHMCPRIAMNVPNILGGDYNVKGLGTRRKALAELPYVISMFKVTTEEWEGSQATLYTGCAWTLGLWSLRALSVRQEVTLDP